MNPPIFERARAVIAVLLLLQSLLGCAAAEDIPQSPWAQAAPMHARRSAHARHGLASAPVGGRWYVIGGGKAGALTFISLTDRVEVFSGGSE
jgi:hypothetical protein